MQEGTAVKTSSGIAARGVWRAPHLQDGYPVIIAVDTRGRRIASIVLARGLTPSRVRRMLQDVLDSVDPVYHLQLVKPGGE